MRYFIFFVSLLLFATVALGQVGQSTYHQYESVRITNPDGLYATVFWKPEMKAELISTLGEETAEAVMLGAHEKTWPKSISNLGIRVSNKTKLLAYKCQYLTTVNQRMAVLLVAAGDNSHMEEGMRPESDFYLVMFDNAIEASNSEPGDRALVFFKNLNAIVVNFEENLSNIMGEDLEYVEENDEIISACTVPLEGSSYLTFHQIGVNNDISFRAIFPGDINPPLAHVLFRDLVEKVSVAELRCCTLFKLPETAKGKKGSQDFKVIAKKDYSPGYQNMVINVTLEAMEAFNTEGQTVTEWTPVIYIYQK